MSTNPILSRDDLLTNCERSMRYHQARARFFNSVHLFIQFVLFALASAGVYNLIVASFDESAIPWMWALVALLALFSLVYNPAGKAGLHQSLYRGFTMLSGVIAATPDPGEATLAEWTRSIHALYADEPPVYRALNAHCNNQIVIALGTDHGYFVDLRWYQRILRNIFPFQGTEFLNRNQAHHAGNR